MRVWQCASIKLSCLGKRASRSQAAYRAGVLLVSSLPDCHLAPFLLLALRVIKGRANSRREREGERALRNKAPASGPHETTDVNRSLCIHSRPRRFSRAGATPRRASKGSHLATVAPLSRPGEASRASGSYDRDSHLNGLTRSLGATSDLVRFFLGVLLLKLSSK